MMHDSFKIINVLLHPFNLFVVRLCNTNELIDILNEV